jgi:hypothetical protein
MAAEYKTFNITGGAAAEYLGGSKRPKKARKTTAKASIKQEGGMAMPLAAMDVPNAPSSVMSALTPTSTSASALTPTTAPASAPTTAPTPAPAPVIHVQATSPQLQQQGGTKNIKVELKRKSAKKQVKLHPKKDGIKKLAMSKKARKVSIGLSSLHKRVRRAQKTQKKVKEMSLEDLKKELIAKKLIKATSKAPESILRQIAADSRIMEKKAL